MRHPCRCRVAMPFAEECADGVEYRADRSARSWMVELRQGVLGPVFHRVERSDAGFDDLAVVADVKHPAFVEESNELAQLFLFGRAELSAPLVQLIVRLAAGP